MKHSTLDFLQLYRRFAAYGPSRFQDEKHAERNPFSITEREFFEKIYITTTLEQNLFTEVTNRSNGNIIALCGPAGSGKSTASAKVKEVISKHLRTKVFFIDLRIEEAGKTYDDIVTIDDSHVRSLILNLLNSEFPILVEGNSTKRFGLYYFLLSTEKEFEILKSSQVFFPLAKLMQKTSYLYLRTRGKLAFKDWFYDNVTSPDLIDIFQEVDELIDVSHFVSYISSCEEYDDIIFWLDNIDSFTNIQQAQIVEILEKLQRNILNETKIVISVREENIYRIGKFTDNFNEPFISQVTFRDPSDNHQFSSCGALNVPVMSPQELNKIVQNKLNFTFERFLRQVDVLETKLHKLNVDLDKMKSTSIAKFNLNREAILRQRRQLENEIEKSKSHKISNVDFENIKRLSTLINDCFENEKVIFLANNSVKTYLRIHGEFLFHIVENDDNKEEKLIADAYTTSHLTTVFLSWIHSVNQPFGVETFNIVEELGRYQNSSVNIRIGCFLPYLVLTRIWNECVHLNGKPSPNNNPFVKDIINDIVNDFGYTDRQVASSLFQLFHQVEGKGNFITFRTKQEIESPDDLITVNTTVRITYRGRVTLGHILNSYGYLKECTERLRNNVELEIPIDQLIIKKVCAICEIHLTQLQNMRDTKYQGNKVWFQDYLRRYGIPLEPYFVRNSGLGQTLSSVRFNRCLYLESLFGSLIKYFNFPNQLKTEIEAVSNQFYSILNKIIDNQKIEIILIEENI